MSDLFEAQAKKEKLVPKIVVAANEKDAFIELNNNNFDIVVFDIDLDKRGAGLDLLKRFSYKIPFPVISTSRKSEEVIDVSYEYGSEHFINKPISENKIEHIFSDYISSTHVNKRKEVIDKRYITQDQEIKNQLENLLYVNGSPIHINGPTGVGKQVIAELAHELSKADRNIFRDINCSTIPEALAESTLFGHVKGAFTGANASQKGLIADANGGTLFLDEIDKLSKPVQAKLLKVIEQKKVRPIGSNDSVKVEFNLITAASQNIDVLVQNGDFLPDLWERLKGEVLWIKPLRDRPLDIEYQFKHFMKNHQSGRLFSIRPEAINVLKNYDWPGNTRELKVLVDRLQKRGIKKLEEHHLKSLLQKTIRQKYTFANMELINHAREHGLHETLDQLAKEIIEHSFNRNSQTVRKTLLELNISERIFYKHVPKKEG
jgi:DNA-binding NtrC family response regulator